MCLNAQMIPYFHKEFSSQALEEQKEAEGRCYLWTELFVVINEGVYSRDINSSVRREGPTVMEEHFRGTWST